ncbi:cysteine alpha-hairpin motif superfamily [Geopyxis carbonaria]|nr:cysteine alpha-hairpin motif superfamily [Geopyxis carbonaria]
MSLYNHMLTNAAVNLYQAAECQPTIQRIHPQCQIVLLCQRVVCFTHSASDNIVQKPTSSAPKPCCVCKEEKALRDECLLFSEVGEEKCLDKIAAYKKCMAGFGFKI